MKLRNWVTAYYRAGRLSACTVALLCGRGAFAAPDSTASPTTPPSATSQAAPAAPPTAAPTPPAGAGAAPPEAAPPTNSQPAPANTAPPAEVPAPPTANIPTAGAAATAAPSAQAHASTPPSAAATSATASGDLTQLTAEPYGPAPAATVGGEEAVHRKRARRERWVPGDPLPPGTLPPPRYRYTPGTPLLEGYRIETFANRSLVRRGILSIAIPYSFGMFVAFGEHVEGSAAWLLVPVAGPWITLATRRTQCGQIGRPAPGGADCFADRYGTALLVADGTFQALGAAFIAWGLLDRQEYAVWQGVSSRVTPSLMLSGYGLTYRAEL